MKKIITTIFIASFILFCSSEIIKAGCPLPAVGDVSFSTSDTCSISSVIGADEASSETSTINTAAVTLPSDTSITINNGGTLALGSIVLSGGSITIQTGGVIEVGKPIYATDSDADGWLDSTTYYTATSSGLRRLGLMKSVVTTDCNSGSFSDTNSCCTGIGTSCTDDSGCCSNICGTNADSDTLFSAAAGHTGTCQETALAYTDCDDSNASIGSHLATGGNVTYYDGDVIHTFTATGNSTFNLSCGGDVTAQVLVVGGGGGGCYGGGGAGGMVYNSSYSITAGSYTVTVGAGGTYTYWYTAANNGGNSVFNDITAIGGGGGSSANQQNGGIGGSGGGAGHHYRVTDRYYGASGTSGQGNKGGDSVASSGYSGAAGGGGAGAAGSTVSATRNGSAGGAGAACSITGTSVYYAGGGGGRGYSASYTSGAGGVGGGGDAILSGPGEAGTDGLGGGGGGGPDGSGGMGGSGVVIIRYPTF